VELPVSFKTAALGGVVKVPTIDETFDFTVPEGTQSGQVFTVRGKGIRSARGNVGNLILKIVVEVPTKLSKEQKRAIENMEKGLYLVLGEPVEMEGRFYNSLPGLVTLPNRDVNGNWTNHATVDFSEKLSLICEEYKVMKVWKDEGYEKKRPEKIEVVLYVDGEEFDTITLNEDNNWEYAWENIPKGAKVTLAEKNVPNGYKVAYKNNNGYIVIENKYVPDKPKDPENSVPQTGQLWWPVPFLAIFGIAFFTIGWFKRNSEER
jgi:hypothetical protein